jgi:predicted phosphodiesterase
MTSAMSVLHSNWVRNTVKFVGAISIPALIIGFYYYAKTNADKEYAANVKTVNAKKDAMQTSVENYELKEVDDNNLVKWELVAKTGTTFDQKKYEVKGVNVKFFDGPNVKMKVTAPLGKVDAETRFVTLNSDKGERVKGEGDSGKSLFESQTVELDKNNKFFATGGVTIEWAESAKVTGGEARGKLDKGGLQDVIVKGHTHAVIAVKD